MKNQERIIIQEFIPVFNKVAGLNAEPLDYRLLKNKI